VLAPSDSAGRWPVGTAESIGHAIGANPNPGSSTRIGRSPHNRHVGTSCPVVIAPDMGVLRTLHVVATTGPLHFLQTYARKWRWCALMSSFCPLKTISPAGPGPISLLGSGRLQDRLASTTCGRLSNYAQSTSRRSPGIIRSPACRVYASLGGRKRSGRARNPKTWNCGQH
jgi:hypothetical protein